jgi:hypothetical protein
MCSGNRFDWGEGGGGNVCNRITKNIIIKIIITLLLLLLYHPIAGMDNPYVKRSKEMTCYKLKRHIKQRKLQTEEHLKTKCTADRFVNVAKVTNTYNQRLRNN